MRNVCHNNLFLWTLRGKYYFVLAGLSLAILTLVIGVA